MKKILFLACLIFISAGFSIEYSLRIKALGPDFAYLIPDYETDLYRDPNLYTRDNKFLEIIPNVPVTLKLLTSRFGLMGRYDYIYNYDDKTSEYWSKTVGLSLKDLWMWDARKLLPSFLGDVWNFNDDLSWSDSRNIVIGGPQNYEHRVTVIKYLFGIPASQNLGASFKFYGPVGFGIYRYLDTWNTGNWSRDQALIFVTGKLGLCYRSVPADNDFTSGYIEVGSPTTINEIDQLPWSILREMYDNEGLRIRNFLDALVSRIAFVKGIPISFSDRSFVAIGFREELIFQYLYEVNTSARFTYKGNMLSFPLGVEYWINKVAVRMGTAVKYVYTETSEENLQSSQLMIDHKLTNGSYCGAGWRPGENFSVDFFKYDISLVDFQHLQVCLKFLF